jgi:hypothetical protein
MKCFNHNDRDAVGICISCKKALCNECLEFIDNQLSCKSNEFCTKRSQSITKAHEYNEKAIPMGEGTMKTARLRYSIGLIVGILFLIIGVIFYISYKDLIFSLFPFLVGMIFVIISIKALKSKSF